MSEQVKPAPKAYQANVFWDRQDCATLSAQVYLASDADSYIDALHAEAEALRAGAGAWKAKAKEALNDWRKACQLNGDAAEREFKLHAELEAAQRGISEAVELIDCISRHPANRIPALDQARAALVKALTATPAPEVRQFDKPSLLKDCNVTYSNSSRPLAEQGERQEAVAWSLRLPDGRTTLEKSYPKWAEGEGDGYAIQPLYTTPQPGPDVRGLVEALEQIARWDGFPPTGKFWECSGEPVSFSVCYGSNGERDYMRNAAAIALNAYRQAQQQES